MNAEPIKTKPLRWRTFDTGLAGFFLAALIAVLTGYLFFRLGMYGWLLHLVPQDQALIRLVAAILLIPLLLLVSLFSQYNPGSSRDPDAFFSLFALIGLRCGSSTAGCI